MNSPEKIVNGPYRAVVVETHREGHSGPWVKAFSDSLKAQPPLLDGTVTFSLGEAVWKEADSPSPGDIVLVYNVYEKKAGWRAGLARRSRPGS
jgi:hypothetical protein